jgi:hypothetical protein
MLNPYTLGLKEMTVSKNDDVTDEQKNIAAPSTESKEALPTILNLHESLPTQVGVRKCREEFKNPRNTIQGASTIEFNISSEQNEAIDIYNTYVYLEAKIMDSNGDVISSLVNE